MAYFSKFLAELSYISGVVEVSDNYSVFSFFFELIGMVVCVVFFEVFYDFSKVSGVVQLSFIMSFAKLFV